MAERPVWPLVAAAATVTALVIMTARLWSLGATPAAPWLMLVGILLLAAYVRRDIDVDGHPWARVHMAVRAAAMGVGLGIAAATLLVSEVADPPWSLAFLGLLLAAHAGRLLRRERARRGALRHGPGGADG